MMKHVYSVGQVNKYIKNMFAQDFMLHHISIKGEVSNCKYHSSGHIYFTMKDADGTINAIMFAGNRREGLKFQMKEGDRVVVTGSVEVYERDGRYQIYARTIERDGEGNLYLKFEALKRELEEMGMFAEEYKQPIPTYAKTVGIVTAETGAAIQDIRNIAGRRNPYVQLILCPALVQGEGAAASIVHGIHALEQIGVDVIIVGRGGGSIEDLWAFNEENVARAIYEAKTPIISGTGHEVDTTIADYAADLRAATPTAACELAVPDITEVMEGIANREYTMDALLKQIIRRYQMKLQKYQITIANYDPRFQLQEQKRRLSELEEQIQQVMKNKMTGYKHKLELYAKELHGLSPTAKLINGFGYLEDQNGEPVTSVHKVKEGDQISLTISDGTILAMAKQIRTMDEKGK